MLTQKDSRMESLSVEWSQWTQTVQQIIGKKRQKTEKGLNADDRLIKSHDLI